MIEKLGEAFRHPLSVAAGAVGAVSALMHPSFIEALFWVLVGNSGSLLTISSIAGFTLPKVFPSLAALQPFLLPVIGASALAYVGRLAYTTYKDAEKKL